MKRRCIMEEEEANIYFLKSHIHILPSLTSFTNGTVSQPQICCWSVYEMCGWDTHFPCLVFPDSCASVVSSIVAVGFWSKRQWSDKISFSLVCIFFHTGVLANIILNCWKVGGLFSWDLSWTLSLCLPVYCTSQLLVSIFEGWRVHSPVFSLFVFSCCFFLQVWCWLARPSPHLVRCFFEVVCYIRFFISQRSFLPQPLTKLSVTLVDVLRPRREIYECGSAERQPDGLIDQQTSILALKMTGQVTLLCYKKLCWITTLPCVCFYCKNRTSCNTVSDLFVNIVICWMFSLAGEWRRVVCAHLSVWL